MTNTESICIVIAVVLFAYWLAIAAVFDWSTSETVAITQPPPKGFELECVDNPAQDMICTAYCGPGTPRPERPHP